MIKKAIEKVCFGVGYSIGTAKVGFDRAISKKNNKKEDNCKKRFADKIESEFTPEEFTGYFGGILEEGLDEDSIKFIQKLYDAACETF